MRKMERDEDHDDVDIFRDEAAAYACIESIVWPDGPVCHHCGGRSRIGLLRGASVHIGTYKCYTCRRPFTVKTGTIFENSNIPLTVWMQALYLLLTRRPLRSADIAHALGVTPKSAASMVRRLTLAMEGAYTAAKLR